MRDEVLINTYMAQPFMQGGRPIAVEEAAIDFQNDGSLKNVDTGRMGRWQIQSPFLEILWDGDDTPERFCTYGEDVTTVYRDHLFAYGKMLVPETVQFDLRLAPINDNPSEHLAGHLQATHPACKRLLSRASSDFFSLFPKNGKFLEVGVGYGNNAERLHRALSPGELHLVDCWEAVDGSSDNYTQENLNDAYAAARQKFAHDPKVILHKALSQDVLPGMQRGYFDMAYIDADHTEEACWRDLTLCAPLVREDGYLCGHDYTSFPNMQDGSVDRKNYGVMEAVDRFCREYGWQMEYLTIEVHDWCYPSFILKRKQ